MIEEGHDACNGQCFAGEWSCRVAGVFNDAHVYRCILHIVLNTFTIHYGAPEYILFTDIDDGAEVGAPAEHAAADIISARGMHVFPSQVAQHSCQLYVAPGTASFIVR